MSKKFLKGHIISITNENKINKFVVVYHEADITQATVTKERITV